MVKFLLEILTEEVPGVMQIKAQEDIVSLFTKELSSRNIKFSHVDSYSTPRRMTLVIDGLPERIEDKIEQKKGPNVEAKPEVIEKFLEKNNLLLSDCEKINNNKGIFLFYKQVTPGGDIDEVIVEIITNVLGSIQFKKSMRWNNTDVFWARPIRGLLALLDNRVLSFKFAGVSSSNKTQGHRFLSSGDITVSSIDNYFESLKNNHVVLDFKDRAAIVEQRIAEVTQKYQVTHYKNARLLEEICYLVEYPEILVGEIPQEYMFLPKELLREVIEKNQRYICFFDKNDNFFNKYIIVSNISTPDKGATIINGNAKVLQARLEDGLFFYNNDLKSTLKEKAKKLKDINFIEGFGSLEDKTLRVSSLFQTVFGENQDNLCSIYKADLCSEVVLEIPELQGVMGYYYAKSEGINSEIALAIKEHYKPQGPSDSLPSTSLGAKLSLLDKLDSLISFFAIGKQPTGSKDPFALRRAAIGIIRIIEEYELDIDLFSLLSEDLRDFFKERLNIYLLNKYHKTAVSSVISSFKGSEEFNMGRIIKNTRELDNLLNSPVGAQVISLHKRVSNILTPESKKIELEVKESLLQNDIEKALFKEITRVEKILMVTDLNESLPALASLLKPVNLFLDNMQIYTKEEHIKNNRVSLLLLVLKLCDNKIHLDR